MEGSVLSKVVLPIALAIVMLGIGLSLTLADFGRVRQSPKAVAVGIGFQMLALPAVGYLVAVAFGLHGALAVGLMVLAFCPGGTTSNVISHIARGDLALSISLTAIVSVVTPVTIPFLTELAISAFMDADQAVPLDYKQTLIALVAITIVPVVGGMAIRRKWPVAADKAEKPVRTVSLILLFLIIAGLLKQQWSNIPTFLAQVGLAAFVLNVTTMAIGFFGAKGFKLTRRQQITIGIEVGVQNGTTALFVTGTLLDDPQMSIAPAVYSLLMFGTAAVFAVLVYRPGDKEQDPPAPASA